MTENDVLKDLKRYKEILEAKVDLNVSANAETALSKVTKAIEEIQAYRAIGTIDEFKALKEKNTPMELAEHNYQDEPHHYLCPVCKNIVNLNQDYCEECGQALKS